MVINANIRAKVLAVRPSDDFDCMLIVLIQKIAYMQKSFTNEITTGKVQFDDFFYKAIFDVEVSKDNMQSMKSRIMHLVPGDIINFSVEREIAHYRFVSLRVEDEQPCLYNYIDSVVTKFGIND